MVSRVKGFADPTIPAKERGGITRYKPNPGFQFVGVAADPKTPGRIALANYNSPAIMIANLVEGQDGSIELVREEFIGWANLPGDSAERRRVFLDVNGGADSKRAQGVIFGPNSELWTFQNTDTNMIISLARDPNTETGWRMQTPILLQGNHELRFIEGACIEGQTLIVLRSLRDGSDPTLCAYEGTGRNIQHGHRHPMSPWVYGPVAHHADGGKLYFITSCECAAIPHGIYCEDRLVVPDVTGTSICFPWPDRLDAFVVEYGEGKGDWGNSTKFVHVPATAFPL